MRERGLFLPPHDLERGHISRRPAHRGLFPGLINPEDSAAEDACQVPFGGKETVTQSPLM